MSSSAKTDHARGWRYVEGLLLEDKVARLEKMSEEELEAELRTDGIDPDGVPSAEELVGRAAARANEQAARGEVDHARGWTYVESLLAEDDAAKEEPSANAPTLEDLIARGTARAAARPSSSQTPRETKATRPAPARARRATQRLWLVAAALAAFLLIFALMNRRAIVAYFNGDEIRPDDQWLPWRPAPTPEERAASIREDAYTACQQERWQECKEKLDDAKRVDPAGDTQPRVVKVRQAIENAQAADAGDPRKLPGK
jgi:hypothetical protein